MDREKLKLIIRNMDLLLDALKSEIYSKPESYLERNTPEIEDYDEIYIEDDDGYTD